MKKNLLYILIIFILTSGVFVFSILNFQSQPIEKDNELETPTLYRVSHVIDGDTIKIEIDGGDDTVRFLGVDTPELNTSYTKEECYGPEASAYLKALLKDQYVYLLPDKQNDDRDNYHRVLRYAFIQDGTFVEEELLRKGYAYNYDYFPFEFMEQFNSWEKEAREKGIGLWGECEKNN